MGTLQLVSVFLEVLVVIVSFMLVANKNKSYGWGMALTFLIYVFYDLARHYSWSVNSNVLYVSFFIASVSALLSVWQIYKQANR